MNLSLRQYGQLLFRHIRPQAGRFILLTLLLLGNILLQVINPQIMRSFIDTALSTGEAAGRLVQTALLFLSIALVQQVVAIGVTYLGENVAWTATNALRAELAWHCLNLDMSFHNQHTPGELIERIDGDVTEVAQFFSQFVVTVLGNGLLLVGVLIALYRENILAGLAFSAFAALALLALNRVRDIAMPHAKAVRQTMADTFGFVEEQLAGTEDIRSSGAVEFSLRQLNRLHSRLLKHERMEQQKDWIISGVVTTGVLALGNVVTVGAGYFLFTSGLVTIGTVYLFVHYLNMLQSPLWTFTHQMQQFQTIGACVERLTELRQVQSKVRDGTVPVQAPGSTPEAGHRKSGAPPALAFDQVTFSYNGDDPVLSSISFHLPPGRVLGLLGRTGSGKTTLTRLLFRLYDPTHGNITLDGQDLREEPLQSLRRRVAIVTQEVQLFQATVRDNLTLFDRNISDAAIKDAIEKLELGEWFRSLPNGLDTQIETGGHSLSAGEGQLLAFTRIFLRDPGLVILDEASSRLDPLTEKHIERAIDRLLEDRTAIIVAHRLHTVHRADDILILDGGRISEWGSRETLAHDPSTRFYSLLQTGLEEVLA